MITNKENFELKPVDELKFREAMSELDGIVSELEAGTLELEESLEKYKRGVELIASLRHRLTDAQQDIDELMGKLSGVSDDAQQESPLS